MLAWAVFITIRRVALLCNAMIVVNVIVKCVISKIL